MSYSGFRRYLYTLTLSEGRYLEEFKRFKGELSKKLFEAKQVDDRFHISIKDLMVYFGEVAAVDKVSFDVERGKLVTLLGPSGSGKTTILNTVAGLLLPSGGSILFGNRDVTYLSPQRRGIGMVFQNYSLYPHMSVFDNIAFPLKNGSS